jgi:hypothetical protein
LKEGAQWHDESEEEKVEKTRAKEAREAKKNETNKEAREGVQKQIEEANLLERELKEERKRVRVEANRVKEEARRRGRRRWPGKRQRRCSQTGRWRCGSS